MKSTTANTAPPAVSEGVDGPSPHGHGGLGAERSERSSECVTAVMVGSIP